jgi:ribosomal protein L12E/L44/L45/RPP1/RPP2
MAALALYDGGCEITSENINTLLTASGNTDVKPYWPALFAGFLKDKIEEVVFAGGAGGPAAAAAGPAADAGTEYISCA